jgi:hypothetical protein
LDVVPAGVCNAQIVGGWVNVLDHHLYVADQDHSNAAEYLNPSGKLVGTVSINGQGRAIGVAIDP